MISIKKGLLLTAIKNSNNYEYNNIFKEKDGKNNQTNKNKRRRIRLEKLNKETKILKTEFNTRNPLNSIEYNSKPLKPIILDNIFYFNNKYNFDGNKIINQNERNRMKTNKSMDLKRSIYTLNKKTYMNKIKNLFNERNLLNKKKTEMILEYKKLSNDELRHSINIKQAKRYNNFMNYLKMKSLEIKKYNEILNNRRILAKNKYTINLAKKLKENKTDIINTNFIDRNTIMRKI